MKRIQLRRKLTGNLIHVRRNMWGVPIRPSSPYRMFLYNRNMFPKGYTWRMLCATWRKRIKKNKIAKHSRRMNRRK